MTDGCFGGIALLSSQGGKTMKNAADLVEISKCRSYLINGYSLIDNKFMQINRNILAKAFLGSQRTGTIVFLHPGTNQLFYQAVLYALTASYLTFDFEIEEYAKQFYEGAPVTLNGRRCKLKSINLEQKIFTVLEDKGTITSNPLSNIYKMKLYEGDAKTLGTRGIRNIVKEAEKFLEEWLGEEYVPNIRSQPFSILVVCNKKDAQEIANSIISDKDNHFLFSELFPSTWFSGFDSYEVFSGNSIRTSPVVMFTNRISIARDIIFNDRVKRIRSVIVNGIDIISSSKQELEDIMKRNSVHSTVLLAQTSYGVLPDFQIGDTAISMVYWSKDALISLLDDLCNDTFTKNPQEILLKKLIDNEIDHETVFEQVLPPFNPELPKICRKSLKQISNFANEDFDIKRFVISAFGLLKLYEQACFPIAFYEELINSGIVSARLPSNELTVLNEILNSRVELELKKELAIIFSALKDMHCALYEKNPKLEKLLSLLNKREMDTIKSSRKAIIVPKVSYALTINTYITNKLKKSINVYSVGKFDDNEIFDCIIVSGVFDGGKYDLFKNNNTLETIVLGYPSEESYFCWLKNEFLKVTTDYEARSILSYEKESVINNLIYSKPEETKLMIELEKQIFEMMPDTLVAVGSSSGGQTVTTLKAIRLIIFENDEFGLFTEHYSPYVFDEKTGKIIEGNVDKLVEGDLLIFAVRDDITDFVDTILEKLIPSTEPTFQEYYRMSRRWKTVLREYMINNNMNYVEISQKLEELGHFRHPVTIRSWLNEDSRIIGPRDEDSFIAIALVTGDNEMARLSDIYCRGCDEVRSMRIRILHYIENQIIKSYADGIVNSQDTLLASVIGDAKQYARGLRISSIKPINREIPASFANRPHGL